MSQRSVSKGWSIGRQLWLLCGGLLVIPVILEVVSISSQKQMVQLTNNVIESVLPATREMTLVDMMHDAIRGSVYRSILISGTKDTGELEEFKTEFAEYIKSIDGHFSALSQFPLPPAVKSQIETAKPNVVAYVEAAKKVVDVAISGRAEAALAMLPEFNTQFKNLEEPLEALGESIEKIGAAVAIEKDAVSDRMAWISMVLLFSGFVVGIAVSWAMVRALQRRLTAVATELRKQSDRLQQTSGGLNDSATALESATTEQSSAIQETAASIDEISAMVKKTSESSKQLEESTNTSQRAVGEGQQAVTQMVSAIQTINESNQRVMSQIEDGNRQIEEMVKVIGEIGTKTKVINDIVFQTKLLSFNASVEAARAGEHGKGFAVVAEEVGNLAQMSGNAAKEISDMLESSMARVQSVVDESQRRVSQMVAEGKDKIAIGTETAHRCGEAFEAIVKESSGIVTMTAAISSAIQEQTQGIEEISRALGMMNQTTQINSQTTQKTAASAAELGADAENLQAVVRGLEAYITGEASSTNPSVAPASRTRVEAPEAGRVVSIESAASKRRVQKEPVREQSSRQVLRKASGSGVPSQDDPRFEDV